MNARPRRASVLSGLEWRVALAVVACVCWAASDFALACWRAVRGAVR